MSESNKRPAWFSSIPYQGILLGGFATLAAALLIGANQATHDNIQLRQQEDLLQFLQQVIPASHPTTGLLEHNLELPGKDGKPVTIYRGTQDGQVNALAWEVSGKGYSGTIRLILGMDETGKILGVRVLSHTETPGLGDKIEAQKSDWILGFNGLSLGNPKDEGWRVKKDGGQFDSFSGATITPRAVVGAIHEGLQFYAEHQQQLLELSSSNTKP